MKFANIAYATLGILAVGSLAWGCSGGSSQCGKDCGQSDEDAAGAPSTSGDTGGSSGVSGSGNEAGMSGDEGGASGVGGGSSGTSGSDGAPCMGTSSPDSAQCVIDDEYGLFVSLAGSDTTGDGTEAKPLATVTKALSLTGKIKRVYVCATANGSTTSYDEPNTLTIPDRVSLYGGFTCVGGIWSYDATVKAWLKPESPVGAIVNGALNGVTVQDVRIDAMNAPEDGTGASSFGMIVKGSKAVTLTRVEVHAGKGGGGAAGADGANGADGQLSGTAQNGKMGTCASAPASQFGGISREKTCGSQGGNGGTAFIAVGYSSLQDGASGFLVDPTNGGKGAIALGTTHPGSDGTAGTSGAPGLPGGPAAPIGIFSSGGYATAKGPDGAPGSPGQGGGGGGASLGSASCVGASGGAGGMGGCGGDPGTGGGGGGASIALLNWNSITTIDSCILVANTGGAGGKGGKAHGGGAGVPGGVGGPLNSNDGIARGGNGGAGGDGGNGGSGAGGSGGPSIALVYNGTKPTLLNNPTLTPGTGGAHGVGGRLGSDTGNWAPDGSDGLSAADYEQK